MRITPNIGLVDKIIRMVISIIMIYFGYIQKSVTGDNISGVGFMIFGGGFLLIALLGYCPLYNLAGINTRKGTN